VSLGSVTDSSVLRPSPDDENQGLRPRVDLAALGHDGGIVKRRHTIHGEVHRDTLVESPKSCRCHQSDLRLRASEGGAPELEAPDGDELVRADTDRRLLQLPGVQLGHGEAAFGQPCLQMLDQNVRARGGNDIELWDSNPEGRAPDDIATGDASDLHLGKDHLDGFPGAIRELLSCPVGDRRRRDLLQQLCDLAVEVRRNEAGCNDGHLAVLLLIRS